MQPRDAYGLIHAGVVTNNRDPEGRGRVKLRVPNVVDESQWVYPGITVGGGGPQEGLFHVPPEGADVYVFFLAGNPDQPRYMGGHWSARNGQPEHPTVVREAEDKAVANAAMRSWEGRNWVVLLDDRPGAERLVIAAKPTMGTVSSPSPDDGAQLVVELDLTNGTLALSAPAGIVLRTQGALDLQGSTIQIGGRAVLQTTKTPI